jgi:glycosyltransferase involved in cell wall biosynthesis
MLPLSVLIPTRNSMSLLPGHIETMRPWLDLAQEIVVVDSESRDGTAELLRKQLPSEKTRFFKHPPGLYQSWNFGIQQVRAPYMYVSTIGDSMSREGLIHLNEVAQKFSCDIVISPPDFVDDIGRPTQANHWPVHRVISCLNLKSETCLEGIIPFLIAWTFMPFAMLGSSASNVYRTSVLKERPFPTDFGWNGDGAWGLANSLNIKLGVTPRCFSSFRKHAKLYPLDEYAAEDADRRMLDSGLAALEKALCLRPEIKVEAERLELPKFIAAKEVALRWRAEVTRQRHHRWPWVLNPFAWRARSLRVAAQEHCEELLGAALKSTPEIEPTRRLAVAVS